MNPGEKTSPLPSAKLGQSFSFFVLVGKLGQVKGIQKYHVEVGKFQKYEKRERALPQFSPRNEVTGRICFESHTAAFCSLDLPSV